MSCYDHIIAIDLGTTTTAFAERRPASKIAVAVSPITNQLNIQQKTPSDIHFFLNKESDPLTVHNSVLGNVIPAKFNEFPIHHHFAFYKMALYDKDEHDKFVNTTNYPNHPAVNSLDGKCTRKLSEVYEVVVQHIRDSIAAYFK